MKKRITILLLLSLFITGCSIKNVNKNDYDYMIDNIIMKKNELKKESFDGFSLYIPKGLKIVLKDDYNIVLKDNTNSNYYVYIDVVSYYNKVKNTYKEDKNAYYSKKIVNSKDKKSGYLEINEKNNKYIVEAVYNYVKIEVYTDKKNLSNSILYISQILSSINYNDKILKTTIGDKELYYKEESFNIFTTKKSDTSYLDYIEKYDSGATKDEKEKSDFEDEDIIDTDIDEE